MRFAWPAYKFEGLYFSHRFFYDLMSLLDAITLNVWEEEIKKFARKKMKAFTPEYLEKLNKSHTKEVKAPIQSRGPHTYLLWI